MCAVAPFRSRGRRRPAYPFAALEAVMPEGTKERWVQLCERAAVETDPEQVLLLVAEINRLLEEKAAGPWRPSSPAPDKPANQPSIPA